MLVFQILLLVGFGAFSVYNIVKTIKLIKNKKSNVKKSNLNDTEIR